METCLQAGAGWDVWSWCVFEDRVSLFDGQDLNLGNIKHVPTYLILLYMLGGPGSRTLRLNFKILPPRIFQPVSLNFPTLRKKLRPLFFVVPLFFMR